MAAVEMRARYEGCMVMAAALDALGYHRGHWEFERDSRVILREFGALGGLHGIRLEGEEWIVSDDTVMHLATAEALIRAAGTDIQHVEDGAVLESLRREYCNCVGQFSHRAPGATTLNNLATLQLTKKTHVNFNKQGGGCGAAMRMMCMGLVFHSPEDKQRLIQLSVEAGRMTHHHPIGYLGGVVAALFTSYAIQGVEVWQWPGRMRTDLELARTYVAGHWNNPQKNSETFDQFLQPWDRYETLRTLSADFTCPPDYCDSVEVRETLHRAVCRTDWPGATGDEAVIIAYDSLLCAGGDVTKLVLFSTLHGGDSDSTGTVAGGWWGAVYGLGGVPSGLYANMEFIGRVRDAADGLFALARHK